MDPEHLQTLVLLGLSRNQALIYQHLVSNVSLTTKELVELTQIPRTSIYSELQELEQKEWIYRKEGRPIQYFAKSPEDIYKSKSSDLVDKLQETQHHLNSRWGEREKFQTQTISVISGQPYLIQETIRDINNAKDSIVLTVTFLFEEEIIELIRALRRQRLNGCSIKVALFPDVYHELSYENQQKFLELDAKLAPVPVRALVIDNNTAILSFNSEGDTTRTETVKITYSNFVTMLRMSFNVAFQSLQSP